MEINVGDYVRYKEYSYDNEVKIGKKIDTFGNVDTSRGRILEHNIAKHSKDIIKVLEKGDILVDYNDDLYVVDHIDGYYVFTTTKVNKTTIKTLVDYQIKKVLTHEQFEANAYKIEKER